MLLRSMECRGVRGLVYPRFLARRDTVETSALTSTSDFLHGTALLSLRQRFSTGGTILQNPDVLRLTALPYCPLVSHSLLRLRRRSMRALAALIQSRICLTSARENRAHHTAID